MFRIFTLLADAVTYQLLGLSPESHLAGSLHFFIEDVTKIFALLLVMIYLISFLRAGLDTEAIRRFLEGKNRVFGYFAASFFGAVTPFCSCSSIPLFLGFTSARIPLGITMAFLITSPIINEVALVLLGSLLGWKFTLLYAAIGIGSGVVGGAFLDLIGAERDLSPLGQKALSLGEKKPEEASAEAPQGSSAPPRKLTLKERHRFAVTEWKEIFRRIAKWVLIGVGLGALLHGFIPEGWIASHLGSGQWWSVPGAVLLGIPLYANASGVIPAVESLIQQGLPIGTAIAFMMSVVAASFPEFMMLKQVMKPRLLVTFFLLLLFFFTLTGWLMNFAF